MRPTINHPLKRATILVLGTALSSAARADLIFEENFDEQPDYTSSSPLTLDGWTHRRNGEDVWSPSTGYPNHHDAFEVLSSNVDKARGGQGKSFVGWRESYSLGWNNWNSDGILAKHFEEGYDELYVSFWVRFSPEWTERYTSKMFRMYSWDPASGKSIFKYGRDGASGPVTIWDYSNGTYGQRNAVSLRGGPHGQNYAFYNGDIKDLPRQMSFLGDLSLNFTTETIGMGYEEKTPEIDDKLNGGFITDNMNQLVEHKQVFGRAGEWTKVAFYVRMNSAPNAEDGTLMQWFDDELIFQNHQIPWVRGDRTTEMVKWNVVAIGGNDFFQAYDNSQMHEEWYAIDDVEIHDEIPLIALPPGQCIPEEYPPAR